MATTTGARAAASFAAYKGIGAGNLSVAYGSHDFGANPSIADVIEICKIPAGAVVLDGYLRLEDIDSNATETLDLDVGTAADPDAFLNGGVRTGDAVVDYLPEGGALIPFHGTLKDGVVSATLDTIVQITVVAAAATFAAGTATVVIRYVNP